MALISSPLFWNSFLAANPDFAGFGKLSAPVCILSDVFLAAKDADELEIMFKLERVGSFWKEKMEEKLLDLSTLTYLPDYCHHHRARQLQIHGLNLVGELCFFVPLLINFYYENEQVWKNKAKQKLLAYQPLISSFSQIYFTSRLIKEADLRAISEDLSTQQLHFQ